MVYEPMLDAVNSCLSGIGESPVDSVDDLSMDVALAVNVIERTSRDIQTRGWWFNKEENWKLTPDPTTGFMTPPINAISVIQNSNQRYRQLTIRGKRIYDVDGHKYDLRDLIEPDGTITFSFVVHLPFDELPPVAQYAIMTRSRRMFAQDLEVDGSRWKFQREDEDQGLAALYREDGRNAKRNYLRDSPALRSLMPYMGSSGKPF